MRIHAFYCMLGNSLSQSICKQAESVWPGIGLEMLTDEFNQMQPFHRTFKQSIPQHLAADALGLDQLAAATHGITLPSPQFV